MCNYFSGILKKNGEVLYLEETNQHVDIIKKHKLSEIDDTDKWLRFEISNITNDLKSMRKMDWRLKIDEQFEPEWYLRNKNTFDKAMWAAWHGEQTKRRVKILQREKEKRKKEREILKKQMEFDKVSADRFSPEIESKLLKEISKMLMIPNDRTLTENRAMAEPHIAVTDPAHVCMFLAKTEKAKRLLSRFIEARDYIIPKIPVLDFSVKKGETPSAKIPMDYVESIIKILKINTNAIKVTTGKDRPVIIENKDIAVYLAPRIDDDNTDSW